MGLFPKDLRWGIIIPVAIGAAVLLAILWLDVSYGGEAEPAPLLGTTGGTPVRETYVPPTATAEGAGDATPRPRPTFAGAAPGTPEERDATRRADLLVLSAAAQQQKARAGSFLFTSGNVQTLCAFQNIDQGCNFKEFIPSGTLPIDPFGAAIQNGYWYSSDGETAKFYAALEGEVPEDALCETEDTELQKKINLICIEVQ